AQDSDVLFLQVLATNGRVVTSYGNLDRLPRQRANPDRLESWFENDRLYATAPIQKGTSSLGILEVGFTTDRIIDEVRGFRSSAVILSLLVLVIAAIIAVVLGRGFARLFEQLRSSILQTARSVDEVVSQLANVTSQQTAAAAEESSALLE